MMDYSYLSCNGPYIYIQSGIMYYSNEARLRERSDRVRFFPGVGWKFCHSGGRTSYHYSNSILRICSSVVHCLHFCPLSLITRAVRGRFRHSRRLKKRTSLGERVGLVSSHAVSRWPRSPSSGGFVVCFECGGISFCFSFCFFPAKHTTCGMYQIALPHLLLCHCSKKYQSYVHAYQVWCST